MDISKIVLHRGLKPKRTLRSIITVNHTMVVTYYEIGKMIIEEEQHGEDRAEYGKGII